MTTALDSWVRTKADELAVDEGCTFDLKAAERVREFFRRFLCHSKGEWAGKPFELFDWQFNDIIAPIFGWKRADGTRRFRKAYVELPKKNGKSSLASGIGLYLLVADNEQGAEVYSAASDRDQASIVHGEAVRMVRASSALSAHLSINQTTKTISFEKTNSWYKALASEAAGREGLNAHGIIVDELHVWHGRALWDALRFAGRSRRQPLLFVITTAGDDPLSVCREQHDYSKGVLRGEILDTRFFACIHAAKQISEGDEEDEDWTDPETWKAANPAWGVTIKAEDFAADCAEAQKTPAGAASFKRYSLNIWQQSANPWLNVSDWNACKQDFTEEDLAGQVCFGGLDLSSTWDLAAFVLCFPISEDDYRFLPYFWLPSDTVKSPDSPEQYRVWAEQRFLEVTPGNVIDYTFVKRRIVELSEKFDLQEYAFDPWNAEATTQELEEQHGIKRVAFAQTIQNFAAPSRELERLILSGGAHHNGHPILQWNVGNVTVKSDVNNNMRPVKTDRWSKKKIDGVVGAIMALSRAMLSTGASIYESRGLDIL